MTTWLEGTVAGQTRWTDRLLSLRIELPADTPRIRFEAGQFGKVALDVGGERIGRPYSFVNAPDAQALEFFYAIVEVGPLSPRLARLGAGDKVFVSSGAAGFLVLSEVPDAANLWLVATGTGVGPFLSILRTPAPWERFRRVTLVYAARHSGDLAYGDTIDAIASANPGRFGVVRITSRDDGGDLRGRIPALIDDGSLEAKSGVALSAQASQVMLCGNPDMVKDAIAALAARGMKKHRRRSPGHITVENYW